jgi:uncharacterized small protein (DUF1192 family)
MHASAPHHCAIADEEEYLGVTEPQRLALHAAARAALGEEEGDTLMALSPPANTDIATRQDIEHSQALMSAQLGEMTAALRAEIARVDARLGMEIARVEAQIERTGSRTLRWTVGTMLAGNAAVVALLTLMLR